MKAKKLSSGSYRTQVVAGIDGNGKRIVKSFTADTEWEAIKMAEEFKRTMEDDRRENITVSRAIECYIGSRMNILEKATIRSYRQIRENRFQSIMDIRLDNLKAIDIQRAINYDSNRVSPKYVKNAYGLLKSVLKMYDVDINLSSIILPKLRKKEKELPDFSTIFRLIHGTEIELPCLLSAWLSLRIGEVCGLQFRDVDTEKRTIKIERTIITSERGEEVRDGCKTEKSRRKLELPEYLFNMIMAIPHKSDTEFIIKLSKHALYSRFKRIVKREGIDMTYHDLRHLNASIMLMLGVPDKYAMERGGWATDNILKSVYQQTFSSERKRVDGVIDDYFNEVICHQITNAV